MTSYLNAAQRGREAGWATNARFRMVTIVAHQRERAGEGRWARDTFTGSCGHTLDAKYQMTFDGAQKQVGRRRRCPQCPADPPKPIPVDHCTYGISNDAGERPCPTRARFNDPGYGLLCLRHVNYLIRLGYLTGQPPKYTPPAGPVQYLPTAPPAPFVPELSPPVRGHLRLVTSDPETSDPEKE